jgi:F-type H+-transporting ATPase subunit epsilon
LDIDKKSWQTQWTDSIKYKGIVKAKEYRKNCRTDNVKKYVNWVLRTSRILNDHPPLITALDIGVLRIKTNDSWEPIILLGGFAEINNNIIVLVNGVEEIKKGDVTAFFNEVEDVSSVLENAKTDKEKLKASQNLKRIASRAQALTFF